MTAYSDIYTPEIVVLNKKPVLILVPFPFYKYSAS